MGSGHTAGFLAVILEISLYIQIGMIANDLDGVLICANGTVRTKSPELAADGSFWNGVHLWANRQRQMGHIIIDTDGVMVLWLCCLHIVILSNDLGRCVILTCQTKAACVYVDVFAGL